MSSSDDEDNIVRIPTLKERERRARIAREAERKRNHIPLFNVGKIPQLVKVLLAIVVAVHTGATVFLDKPALWDLRQTLGFVPAYFSGDLTMPNLFAWLGPITHMALHSGWLHLGVNSFMLLAFGTMVERALGAKRMVLIFALSGIAGALVFLVLHWGADVQLIGASGGISGLFGAALLMMQQNQSEANYGSVRVHMGGHNPWRMVWIWAGIMVLIGMLTGGSIAWEAHVGGYLAGAFIAHGIFTGKIRI